MSYVLNKFDWKQFQEPGRRCIIIGPSGSGKTYLLTNVIYPAIYTKYHIVWILTLEKNKDTYLNMIPKKGFYLKETDTYGEHHLTKLPLVKMDFPQNVSDVERNISEVMTLQKNTDRKYNILLIYDDVLDLDLRNSSLFMTQFTNFRTMNITLIFLIQSFTKVFNNMIMNNCSHVIAFDQDSQIDQHKLGDYIGKYINHKYREEYNEDKKKNNGKTELKPMLKKKDIQDKIDQIYGDYVTPAHACIIYDTFKKEMYMG